MSPMDGIGRANFCRLVNRTKNTLAMHRSREEVLFWCELPKTFGVDGKIIAFDAALFLIAEAFVSQGPLWKGIGLMMPGLQLTLRDAIDRPGTFAAIALLSDKEFLTGAGTIEELRQQGIVGVPFHHWLTPIPPVVAALRDRAEAKGIALPARLAPPLEERPLWAQSDPRWSTYRGGVRVEWQPQGATTVAPVLVN